MEKKEKKAIAFFRQVAISQKGLMIKSWFLAQINRKIDNNMGFFSAAGVENDFSKKLEKLPYTQHSSHKLANFDVFAKNQNLYEIFWNFISHPRKIFQYYFTPHKT